MRSVNKVTLLGAGKCRTRDFSERQGNLFRIISLGFDNEGLLNAFEIVEDG